jgi:hypothetical protein
VLYYPGSLGDLFGCRSGDPNVLKQKIASILDVHPRDHQTVGLIQSLLFPQRGVDRGVNDTALAIPRQERLELVDIIVPVKGNPIKDQQPILSCLKPVPDGTYIPLGFLILGFYGLLVVNQRGGLGNLPETFVC